MGVAESDVVGIAEMLGSAEGVDEGKVLAPGGCSEQIFEGF